MSESTESSLPQLPDRSEMEKWLRDKPAELRAAFGVRLALLVFPMAMPKNKDKRSLFIRENVMMMFRLLGLSWSVSCHENTLSKEKIKDAIKNGLITFSEDGNPVVEWATTAYAYGVFSASFKSRDDHFHEQTNHVANCYEAAANALLSGGLSTEAVFELISEEFEAFNSAARQGKFSIDYVRRAIFSVQAIHHLEPAWLLMKNELLKEDAAWINWIHWAEARFNGGLDWPDPVYEELIKWGDEWNSDSTEVNRRIAALLAKQSPETTAQNNHWDFFLSFSNLDIDSARWIDQLLRAAGFKVFFQPRDMPPGSNFVHEMNNGLANSSKVIALISPNYEASPQCQNEWAAAYNSDPNATKRSLIQMLIAGVVKKPLSKQLVYIDLQNLSADEQAAVVLRTVGYDGSSVEPPADPPGLSRIAELKKRVDTGYQVQLSADRKLTRAPAQQDDTRDVGFSPEKFLQYVQQIVDRVAADCSTPTDRTANNAIPELVQRRVRELKAHFDTQPNNLEPLSCYGYVQAAYRQIARSLKSGDLAASSEWADHKNDLREARDIMTKIYPSVQKFRNFTARGSFEAMEPDEKLALREWRVAIKDSPESGAVLDLELRIDLGDVASRSESANEVIQHDKSDDAIELAADSSRELAIKSLSVADYLYRPREMLKRAGIAATEMEAAVAPFDKLYQRVKGPMGKLFDFFMQWA